MPILLNIVFAVMKKEALIQFEAGKDAMYTLVSPRKKEGAGVSTSGNQTRWRQYGVYYTLMIPY